MIRPSRRVQLAAVFRKEVRQTVRDRRMMFLLVMAPLLQTVLFGYAVEFEVDRVPTVVVDFDGSIESRAHARRLLADGTLLRVGSAASVPEAERAIDDGRAAAALILPLGFGGDLLAGRPADVQVLLDGTDPNRATVASGAAARYFGEVGQHLLGSRTPVPENVSAASASIPVPENVSPAAAANARPAAPTPRPQQRAPELELRPRILFNPGLKTPPFMVPGIAAMLLVVVTTIVTSMGLAREREMGTLEQVLVTPIRPLDLLVGKMAPFVVIGLVDVALLMSAGAWLFDVPLRGNLLALLVGTLLYLMTTLGVGLLISTISGSQQQAFLGGFLFVMPAILLSGVMTPIRGMPAWLQPLTYLNPLRYYAEVMRAVLLRNAGFTDLWPQLVALALFGAALLALATTRFQKRLA